MLVLTAYAFVGGFVTILSPCILPLLPVILSGSLTGGKSRPWGIVAGFIVSFTLFTLTISSIIQWTGVSPDVLRWVAAVIIIAFGIVMLITPLKEAFMRLATRLTVRKTSFEAGKKEAEARKNGGFGGGLVLGASLGLVWTPCVGPIMASVITLALSQTVDFGSVIITLTYSVGTAFPLVLIMFGGRGLLNRVPGLFKHMDTIQKVFSVLMIVTGIALIFGWDRQIQSALLQAIPQYGSGLTSIEDQQAVHDAIDARESGL